MTDTPTFDNPIWHQGNWRVWQTGSGDASEAWAYAHEDADREDELDRRHGTAPSLEVAKQDIDDQVNTQIEIEARSKRS